MMALQRCHGTCCFGEYCVKIAEGMKRVKKVGDFLLPDDDYKHEHGRYVGTLLHRVSNIKEHGFLFRITHVLHWSPTQKLLMDIHLRILALQWIKQVASDTAAGHVPKFHAYNKMCGCILAYWQESTLPKYPKLIWNQKPWSFPKGISSRRHV